MPVSMKQFVVLLILIGTLCCNIAAQSWETPFEAGKEFESATYSETIAYYQRLADFYPEIQIREMGMTDIGKPLHVVFLSNDHEFDPEVIRKQDKSILLINNGIHAGEPCGIDASMMLARDLVQQPDMFRLLDHVFVAIIPAYNIGGMLNRGCCSRANQNGPKEYGFRGNARNYDLNRDFIKADTRNAAAFARVFQYLMPDIFVDTHTTNGADYQATLTYIPTHPVKAGEAGARYMQETLLPALEAHMSWSDIQICPYVNNFRQSPDHGISGFLDLPRYSSGYASLFQTMSFITEAHMLKPFKDRVWATYHFLEGLLSHLQVNYEAIEEIVKRDREAIAETEIFDVAWTLDRTKVDSLLFAGYTAKTKPSTVSGLPRLYYDRKEPYQKNIPFFNTYQPSEQIRKPTAYLIPQSQQEVLGLLQMNEVQMYQLDRDTTLTLEVSYIDSHHTLAQAYEGHYYHDQLGLRKDTQEVELMRGDYVVFTKQVRNAYIVHVLEPKSQDSYFRWNYFDSFLMRKEYIFSLCI